MAKFSENRHISYVINMSCKVYLKLYIKFVANNGKNRDSVHAAISFYQPKCLEFITAND